jgi:hypothetical protein
MYFLLVTDEGMEDLEDKLKSSGHQVVKYSISSDIPPEVDGILGNWVPAMEHADMVILDDRLKKKYSGTLKRRNGSALSISQVITNLMDAGLLAESITENKIIKRRWWRRNGN